MEGIVVSSYFSNKETKANCNELSDDFLNLCDELNHSLQQLKLPREIECIYNPTIYARQTFEKYVRKYCNTKKHIMYFGMNPGPWGMSQTGVPFGEISSVRDWLGITGFVEKPSNEILARQVTGFDCTKVEVSGKRFWGLLKKICGTPENFFKTSFVYNYLPQQWMKNSGLNLTPGDFKISDMRDLFNICDPIFIKILELYEVKIIVAIGKFCEKRAKEAMKKYSPSKSIQIIYIPHPSPRAVNNNNWNEKAIECLKEHNLLQYYTSS